MRFLRLGTPGTCGALAPAHLISCMHACVSPKTRSLLHNQNHHHHHPSFPPSSSPLLPPHTPHPTPLFPSSRPHSLRRIASSHAAKYVSERTVGHHVSPQRSSQHRVTRTGVASTWRKCTVTTTASTRLQRVPVCLFITSESGDELINLCGQFIGRAEQHLLQHYHIRVRTTCTTSEFGRGCQ